MTPDLTKLTTSPYAIELPGLNWDIASDRIIWCQDNLGRRGHDWMSIQSGVAFGSLIVYYFVREEDLLLFILKWA